MRGIHSATKEAIEAMVEELFNKLTYRMLGNMAKLKDKKFAYFTSNPNQTLAHLFIENLGNRVPLPKEQEILKNLISTTQGYVETLKEKTKNELCLSIDSYMKDSRAQGNAPEKEKIKELIQDGFNKAGNHLKTITDTEATKVRNISKAVQIGRVSASLGQDDPRVVFICVHDNKLCPECRRLHLMPDGITPRVWKMSELGYGYHKKGDPNPKVGGLHVNERCFLSMLNKGFGFKDGKVSFINLDHDELENQRND